IGVTGAGFYVIGTRRATSLQLALAGLFMGTGIVGMHYTGMAAMHVNAQLSYDLLFVALSVFIAIAASIAALSLSFRNSAILQRASWVLRSRACTTRAWQLRCSRRTRTSMRRMEPRRVPPRASPKRAWQWR